MPQDQLVAAGTILRRTTGAGDRWLLLRAAKHGEWGFPKGHQDPGEGTVDTALRECVEETGIALLAIEGAPLELHYRLPDGRAKTVVYYPALTASSAITLSDEHDDCGWMDADGVLRALPHANLRTLFAAYLRDLRR
ncbi:MAG: NUDIX domain-containing protein [Planctomycetes bacterium]|nr:NUDIX domain-containing protein [Planctomycetota bacterium]